MQGIYKLYLDGDLVACHNNLITNQGKSRIRQMLAGNVNSFASSILVGIGEDVANVNNTRLTFAIDGANISGTMIDDVNNAIYFKSSLPVRGQYVIYELGCFAANSVTSQQIMQNALLMSFGDSPVWVSSVGSHSLDDTFTRIGTSSIHYNILASATAKGASPMLINLDQLDSLTIFSFAFYASNINSIKLRFKNSDADYYEYVISSITDEDYNIATFTKGDFIATGSPTWSNIISMEVEIQAQASNGFIDLDGLRYDSAGQNNLLLSRALAADPTMKPAGSTLDIEYILEGIV